MNKRFLLSFIFFTISFISFAQEKEDVYVDENGLMRWGHNDEEVKGFGVNYSVPFAHAYRSGQKLNVDLKGAIDNDVYHFSRLGFDLYRIHVWDTEISDEEGNLIENEHLELFDYLLKKLKERDINFVITPIAYWGNGWPEPDEDTPGFSNKYGKAGSLTEPGALKAQQNYLKQFLDHVNPYTGVAYKNESNLIAFEISNEPHHKGEPQEVQEFIEKMVSAMKSTGTNKPIFYNVSHSIHLAESYFDAGIDGGTFQWYPTGLGFQKELEGNLLPNVNDYHIPFNEVIEENNAAKLVYEFDAADVMKSYIYPAMARSFREAGIQIGTHFAYDPTYLAFGNTEYDTHYMNLAYTPQKALALMIAGEIFHQVPVNSDFGVYPENLEFQDFRVDYAKDLAVLNSGEKFIYTNSNEIQPKSLKNLRQVAGFGNSEVIKYEGKGAYFLDKLEDGVWRLEVMPDAILIDNPFGSNSLEKTVAVIKWNEWEMSLDLPGLNENFSLAALNKDNEFTPKVKRKCFKIRPGTYLLKKEGAEFNKNSDINLRFELEEFTAPESTVAQTYVLHEPINELTENFSAEITAEIVSDKEIEKVEAWLQNGNTYEAIELENKTAYNYSAEIPESMLKNGFLEYRIIVTTNKGKKTFPGQVSGSPEDWDFYSEEKYSTPVVKENKPLYIFNAAEDEDYVVGGWNPGNKLVPTDIPGEAEYRVKVEKLFEKDVENPETEPVYDYSFRYNFNRKIAGRKAELKSKDSLVIKARALTESTDKLQIALVMKNGAAFGTTLELDQETNTYKIDLSTLKPVKTVSLPRPYPSFLPYYFEHSYNGNFKLENVEALQFSIGPGIEEKELENPHGVGIISVSLE
ncbi:cellulase family glycosylhydrolase [Salegentibacter mishustinae]|uniref:cellulase family glycosylhydrolase n=1 Tax=Salegentibacter mishustinae TaxID=270918 RepID=UPI001CE14274|nr:cellulase family glycosylhydrolase [Salegentibacter mishustinae]UBZ06965.1 cellulase family glycosylhydrolase [Salegentibacter mishustinae]